MYLHDKVKQQLDELNDTQTIKTIHCYTKWKQFTKLVVSYND